MRIIKFIVYGNLLISLSAGVLTAGVSSFLGSQNELSYLLTVFFGTLCIYNFQRIPRMKEIEQSLSRRHSWLGKNRLIVYILTVLGLAGGACGYFYLLRIKNDLLFLIIIGIIGVFYALKIGKTKALRDIPFVKIHLIALVWVLICFAWPLLRLELFLWDHLEILFSIYLYILAITIPFDIRDLEYDNPKKRTFPQVWGIKLSKRIALLFLLVSFSILAISNENLLQNPFYFISLIGSFILIFLTEQSKKEMYFSAAIDGWIIFFGLMFYFS